MGKYSSYNKGPSQEDREKRKQVHPIWRGIGFILIILIPILAFALALLTIQANTENQWIPIPRELIAKTGGDPLLFVKIILTIVFIIVLYGVFSFLTFFLYRFIGPPRYGPLDVPPVTYRGKQYKR